MYGQDADAEQVMSWTGLGYGGYGWDDAYFVGQLWKHIFITVQGQTLTLQM